MRKQRLFISAVAAIAISSGAVAFAPSGTAAGPDPGVTSVDRSTAVVTGQAAPSKAGTQPTRLPTARPATLPPDYPFWNLQLNVCNSGIASCYENGQSIPEAQAVIAAWYPDVVTVNEVCLSDIENRLFPTMSQTWAGDWTFYVFMPAWHVSNNAPYQCTGGRGQYGNAVLGHVLAADWAGVQAFGGIFQWQASGATEWRSWACGAAIGNYVACSTHLSSDSSAAAMLQCNDLLRTHVPAVWNSTGGYRPSVVGGDFNLKYNGSPNIQDCVPSGWYRKGDGDVQHWFVRNELTFDFSQEIALQHTDHPGWLVATVT